MRRDGTITPLLSPMTHASAPAKLILCGEHAVVYHRPALAVPLNEIRAHATIAPGRGPLTIEARDLNMVFAPADAPDHPLSALIRDTLRFTGVEENAPLRLTLTSDIPIASGMGSGAAIATAIVRALCAHTNTALSPAELSALVYASEQRLHGTPSGIDNAVVAFGQPIWFCRIPATNGTAPPPDIQPILIGQPIQLVVGDTGVRSPTHAPVGAVRQGWQAAPAHYNAIFDDIAGCVVAARQALADGDIAVLGPLLSRNHALLQQLGVSSPELDRLVDAAHHAGALGAKLSGAGWGGVMLALTTPDRTDDIGAALRQAGAVRVLSTQVGS